MKGDTPRVLIVEDDFIIGEDIRQMVRSLGLATVGPISGVAPALAVIRDVRVDAALLDVNIDDGLSFAIADALDAERTPYAFVTGYRNLIEDEPRFANRRVISKPFRLPAIAEALREFGCL